MEKVVQEEEVEKELMGEEAACGCISRLLTMAIPTIYNNGNPDFCNESEKSLHFSVFSKLHVTMREGVGLQHPAHPLKGRSVPSPPSH